MADAKSFDFVRILPSALQAQSSRGCIKVSLALFHVAENAGQTACSSSMVGSYNNELSENRSLGDGFAFRRYFRKSEEIEKD